MIYLHPTPDAKHNCPYCQVPLQVQGWHIPGMRNLADLSCSQCGREFYGDLPVGQALYTPMLLEKATGNVHNKSKTKWFADWFRDSYASRTDFPINFTVEDFRPLERPLLLNCLDMLYGHCLLKLLNTQYYLDHRSELDLVVLVPRILRWMVPEGVAAIWTVDLPLKRGIEWNDWLAAEIKRRIEPFETCWLSVAFSHPHPKDYDIERFTQVHPFPIDEWENRLQSPAVTFIWREDRLWSMSTANRLARMAQRVKRRLLLPMLLNEERRKVWAFAKALRQAWPTLDFAVVGLGRSGGFPDWITDLRTVKINESIERQWCERYAASHIVVGVHGSNMLLPSAHAGAVIELMPHERWGNALQDLLFGSQDCRETLFRYRLVPLSVEANELAEMSSSLLKDHFNLLITMRPEFCNHDQTIDVTRWSTALQQHLPKLPS